MVRDDCGDASWLQAAGDSAEQVLQAAHLSVDFYSQSLVYPCEGLVRGHGRKNALYCRIQVSCRADRDLLSCSADQGCHFPAVLHLSVGVENVGQAVLLTGVQQVCGTLSGGGVHPHVQWGIETERKPPLRGVELMRGYSEVGQNAVSCMVVPEVADMVVDEAEIAPDGSYAAVLGCIGYRIRIHIQAYEPAFGSKAGENGAAVPPSAKCSVNVDAAGVHLENIHTLSEHYRYVICVAHPSIFSARAVNSSSDMTDASYLSRAQSSIL